MAGQNLRARRDAPQPWHAGKQRRQVVVCKHLPSDVYAHFLEPSRKYVLRNASAAEFQRSLKHTAANILQFRGRAWAHHIVGATCSNSLIKGVSPKQKKTQTCVIKDNHVWYDAHQVGERAKGETLMIDAFAEFGIKPVENSSINNLW
jgi:hypothetical protein